MAARHAYLVLCHTCPEQINTLTSLLVGEHAEVFIHLDARCAPLLPRIATGPGVCAGSTYDIVWGSFAMVRATLDLLRQALGTANYDYLHLLSGQCLPLHPAATVQAHFERGAAVQPQLQYIDCAPFPVPGLFMEGWDRVLVAYPSALQGRFRGARAQRIHDYKLTVMANPALQRDISALPRLYHGSQWFSITGAFARYILEYCAKHQAFTAFFEESLIPDEMFFQTILMDSPFGAAFTRHTSRYMDWKRGGPYVLRENDVPAALASGAMFARKFDIATDEAAVARVVAMIC